MLRCGAFRSALRDWAVEYPNKSGSEPLRWVRVEFVEVHASGRSEPCSPEDYLPRFEEIVEEGRCSWINFTAAGVRGGALLIEVETGWQRPPGSVPAECVNVNFSGPPLLSGFRIFPPSPPR